MSWNGRFDEFGAVAYNSRRAYHGIIGLTNESRVEVFTDFEKWLIENVHGRPIMVSDTRHTTFSGSTTVSGQRSARSPFGHSASRISDFYAGLVGHFSRTQEWKRLRITPPDHNPVHDALGNVEAFERLPNGER